MIIDILKSNTKKTTLIGICIIMLLTLATGVVSAASSPTSLDIKDPEGKYTFRITFPDGEGVGYEEGYRIEGVDREFVKIAFNKQWEYQDRVNVKIEVVGADLTEWRFYSRDEMWDAGPQTRHVIKDWDETDNEFSLQWVTKPSRTYGDFYFAQVTDNAPSGSAVLSFLLIPATKEAKITVDTDYGPPGTDVDLTGDDFDPNEDVEIRWDTSDGTRLTTVKANSTGSFKTKITIPAAASNGQHTIYAVSGKGVRATTTFVVGAIEVHGTVSASLRGGLPLQGAEVALMWEDPAGIWLALGTDITDEQGKYSISSPDLRVPMPGRLLLSVTLREGQFNTFTILDNNAGNSVVQSLFGMHGEIGAKPDDSSTWFTINTTGDLEKNLRFKDLNDDPATGTIREDHALDAAIVYYHTHQAMRFYRDLGAPFRGTPVQVTIYSPRPTSAGGNTIFINRDDSDWNNGNTPKNREWHEFSHYITWSLYGAFPPRHYEVNDINGNGVIDEDVNHGGYWGNWMSSSDAMTEGFAEFMSLAIADQMKQQQEIYLQDNLEPYIYTVGTPYPQIYNFEINRPQTIYSYVPAFYSGYSIPDEEICVASTLWDLYDGSDAGDRDHVSLSITKIWQILSATYTFPQYYDNVAISQFTGDDHTYAGRWTGESYDGTRSLKVPFPTMTRNIWYIKDLYDALVLSLPGQKSEIDRIFLSHEIYMDTFRTYEDYTTLEMDDVSTFGDEASDIDLSISPEASYDFWGKGIVADLDVSGWGSGFTIDKYPPYYDARGYLYLWMWVNAPEGTTFDIVVEDDDGQWLCSGISSTVMDVTETPIDMTGFKRGTGHWENYVAVLSPSSAAEQYKFVYDFRPNTNYRTPEAGTSGPDISKIKGIGVLFTTPGSYKAEVGAVVLNLDYPWKPGMESIKGIGDDSQGHWRPYRRDLPPLNGSMALVHVNEAPATLMVSMNYAPPYEDLSFTYPLEIKKNSEDIWLYIEPAFEGMDNTVSIVAVKDGFETSRPFTMTSTQYWDNLGKEGYVAEVNLNLIQKRGLTFESRSKPAGSTIQIPLTLSGIKENIGNMDLTLRYDPSVLEATEVIKGGLTTDSLFDYNILDGTIKISLADKEGFSGDGSIAYVNFNVIGAEGSSSDLEIAAITANRADNYDALDIQTHDGLFNVITIEEGIGDGDGDGEYTALDALYALQMSVEKIPEDPVMDVNEDGSVTSFDARTILRNAVE